MKWFIKCLKKYFDFRGRATRREFWLFVLSVFVLKVLLTCFSFIFGGGMPVLGFVETLPTELMPSSIDAGIFFSGLIGLVGLLLIIPTLSVTARRLRDAGRSPWWLLVYFIVTIGSLLSAVYFALSSITAADHTPLFMMYGALGVALLTLILMTVLLSLKSATFYGE